MNIKSKNRVAEKLIATTNGGELELWETSKGMGYTLNTILKRKSEIQELGVFLTRGIIWVFVK